MRSIDEIFAACQTTDDTHVAVTPAEAKLLVDHHIRGRLEQGRPQPDRNSAMQKLTNGARYHGKQIRIEG